MSPVSRMKHGDKYLQNQQHEFSRQVARRVHPFILNIPRKKVEELCCLLGERCTANRNKHCGALLGEP
jgi:hypothetical protein